MDNVFGSKTDCRDQLLKMDALEDSEIYENVYEICRRLRKSLEILRKPVKIYRKSMKIPVSDEQIFNNKILEFQRRAVVLALAARSPSENRRNAAIRCVVKAEFAHTKNR